MMWVNVFTVHKGHFSPTAKVTAVVTAALNGCMLLLFCMYTYLVEKMKAAEDRKLEERAQT
jgi:hypothetical protein